MQLLKTAFHVHTDYSDDSNNSLEHLLEQAQRAHIHCLSITDHDTLAGAKALAAMADPNLRVIMGEEISSQDGHIIGLFLSEHVAPGMPARETAEAIKRQGGLVVVPHPFSRLFNCGLRHRINELVDLIDAVEVWNAQSPCPWDDRRAERFAFEHNLPALVGVDSHHRNSLGVCYQWLPAFDGPAGFLAALRRTDQVRRRHSLGYFFRSGLFTLAYRLGLGTMRSYGANCPQPRPKHAQRLQPEPLAPRPSFCTSK